MTLLEYISDTDRKRELAAALVTDPNYLWQLATSWRGKRPSVEFAKRIELATNGQVRATGLLGLEEAA